MARTLGCGMERRIERLFAFGCHTLKAIVEEFGKGNGGS